MDAPLTLAIIAITILVSYLAWENPSLFNRLALTPYSVKYNKEYDRMIGHTMVHADWMHLGFNMYTFYSFGQVMEVVMVNPAILQSYHPQMHVWSPMAGKVYFLIIYFLGGVIAALPAIWKHSDHIGYRSVGASGAVSAVMMAFMLLFPQMEVGFFMIIPMPAWIGALVFLGLEHYFSKKGSGLIAHDAHIWGAIGGIVMMGVLDWHFYIDFVKAVSSSIRGFF
jgi:membrane associated rhomboid family serine protease